MKSKKGSGHMDLMIGSDSKSSPKKAGKPAKGKEFKKTSSKRPAFKGNG